MQHLNQFLLEINKQLELNLSLINTEDGLINKFHQNTECYYDIILQLKQFVTNYKFNDINEEINFFKNIKPHFLSEYIFNQKALQILTHKPIGKDDAVINYFENKLRDITCFFSENQDFYQYYRLDSNFLDTLYFCRHRKEMMHLTNHNFNNFDPLFNSSHDYLRAQIIAYEQLVTFLNEQIDTIIYQNKIPKPEKMEIQCHSLQWTANIASLIELIYALHTNNCINNGDCDIRVLTAHFEQIFNIKTNDIYRKFQDIKARKNSQTKFIDSLKTSLLNKINEDYL